MKKLFLLVLLALPFFMKAQKPVFNHLALYVTNLQNSTTFYKDVIGLDTIPEPFHDGKHTWFAIGPSGHLHVIAGAASATPHLKDNHMCFSVPSVDAFVARLNKAKVAYEDVSGKPQSILLRVDGVKQIYFKDPDGYWIEINDATH
jgi:lactoylglutathione lyase